MIIVSSLRMFEIKKVPLVSKFI